MRAQSALDREYYRRAELAGIQVSKALEDPSEQAPQDLTTYRVQEAIEWTHLGGD